MANNQDYTFTSTVRAGTHTLLLALEDVDQIRQWWANPVTGSGKEGGELKFGFLNSDDTMLVYVDIVNAYNIQWTVREDTAYNGDWIDTRIAFDLISVTDLDCVLHFTHFGLHPKLSCYENCSKGWDYFLERLVAHCESLAKLSEV